MFEDLAKKLLDARKNKSILADEVIGKKFELTVAHKALSIDEKNFTIEFVMSTSSVDRHGDVIDQDSWILDYFLTNPIGFLQHESYRFPAGQWKNVRFESDPDNVGKTRMVGTFEFAVDEQGFLGEDVERAWRHYKRRDMNMVSVGFIPHRIDYDELKDAFVLFDCELLECSLVGIGSNRGALAKTVDEDETRTKALEAKKALDDAIKASNNSVVIGHLKARSNLNKAIRHLHLK